MHSFNEARGLWIVAESLADLPDDDLENSFADEGPRPNAVEKFVFANKPARTFEKIIQHCKGFRPELYGPRAIPQALVSAVHAKGIEDYLFFVTHGVPN